MAPLDPQIGRARDSRILGCTEVGVLLNGVNRPIPSFDTAIIHCKALLLQSSAGRIKCFEISRQTRRVF